MEDRGHDARADARAHESLFSAFSCSMLQAVGLAFQ